MSSTGGMSLVRLRGELDMYSAGLELQEIISQCLERACDVVIDASGVSFVDSTGLSVLLKFHQALRSGGRAIALLKPSDPVLRVLEISGLSETLPSFADLNAARQGLKSLRSSA